MLKHSLLRKIRNETIKQGTSFVKAAKFLSTGQSPLYLALQKGQILTTRTLISQAALRGYQVRIRPLLLYRCK
jgi:hypothetical protein